MDRIHTYLLLIGILCFELAFCVVSPTTVSHCFTNYLSSISAAGLPSMYINRLKEIYVDNFVVPRKRESTLKVVLDVGLGSVTFSEVYRHMVQLNVSGTYSLRRHYSKDCLSHYPLQFDVSSVENSDIKNKLIYTHYDSPKLHDGIGDWITVLTSYDNVKVLMNDITDEEYFNNQYTYTCNTTQHKHHEIPDLCYLPMIKYHNIDRHSFILTHYTFHNAKIVMKAYRKLIQCLVPENQLYSFNLNEINHVDYWTQLVSFLGITLPATSSIKYLSEGGTVCTTPSPIHDKLVNCAEKYSESIATIYGAPFKRFVKRKLLQEHNYPRYAPIDSDRILLNVAPGTTGTRTIQFCMEQLNITSHHFGDSFVAPSLNLSEEIELKDYVYGFKVLSKIPSNYHIYEGDSPTNYRWFHTLRTYPNTKFIMTDVDNIQWYLKRSRRYCDGKFELFSITCLTPMPFMWVKESLLDNEFFVKASLRHATAEVHNASFNAYKDLLRCSIVPENMWTFRVTELKDAAELWDRLSAMSGAELSKETRAQFIANGVPKCGVDGCYWGGVKRDTNIT